VSDRVPAADVREAALALPGTTEQPHFDMTSYRVRGKIFATVPPDGEHLHVFLEQPAVQASVAQAPAAIEPLRWGSRVRGVRIRLAGAPADLVRELIEEAWRRKAGARLAASLDRAGS